MSCEGNPRYIDLRNRTDEEITYWLLGKDSIIAEVYIGIPISIFGLLVNIAFLFTLARVPSMRTITNFYLGNLAFADCSYMFIVILNMALNRVNLGLVRGMWYIEKWHCLLFVVLIFWPYYASMMFVTLVSFERFMAICHPLKHRMINSWGRTYKLVVTGWFLCLIPVFCQMPTRSHIVEYCFTWPERHSFRTSSTRFCRHNFDDPNVTLILYNLQGVLETFPFMIALVLNVFFYYKIIRTLAKRASEGPAGTKSDQKDEIKKQVARMLIFNGVVFFLCGLPYTSYIFALLTYDWGYTSWYNRSLVSLWSKIGLRCNNFNSAINPVIYGTTNPHYRRAFMKAFGFSGKGVDRGKQKSVPVVSQSTDGVTGVGTR